MPALGNHLDFAKYEARNVVIQNGNPNPAAGQVKGQLWMNNVDNTLYYWDGTSWVAAKSGAPTGNAGGDLAGTYPNPTIGPARVDDTHVKAANKDGTAGTPSLRTLGTGATQAAAGNDGRFTDARTPTAHKATHEPGGSDAMTVNAAVGVGSLRTLALTALAAMPGDTPLNAIAAPTADVTLNARKLTNLADPVGAQDAATKNYVDAAAQGLDAKASVRVAYATNITLTGAAGVEGGTTPGNGDRVLVMGQSTQPQNGLYVVNTAGAWTRTPDADTWNELVDAYVFVEQGSSADNGYVCTVDQGGTLGTTAVTWVQFSGAGQITAGAGLTKNGNLLDVGAGPGITVNADSVQVANDGITNAMLADGAVNLATADVTGTLPLTRGGTGATDATGVRNAIAGAGYYSSATHGAGTTITFTQATHGLRASRGLNVQCQVEATGAVVLPDITVAANGDVTVTFGTSQTANTIRTTIVG